MKLLEPKLIKEIVLYAVGGGVAFIVTFSTTYILTEIVDLYYLVSAGVAYIAGFIVNFTFQDKVTFRSESFTARKSILFFIVQCVGLFSMLGLLYALTEWAGVHYLLSLIIASTIIAAITFSLSKWWVFRKQ